MKSTLLPPREWSDFENLCCDIWQKIWGKENVQRFGRQGQSQHGIDILFQGNDETKAVQCKLTSDELTTDDIDNIIEKAKEFEPKLSKFVIATSAKRDSKIQSYIAELNKNRENGIFETHIWAWHDINEFLDDNIEIMRIHYSEYVAKFFDKLIFSLFEKIKKLIDNFEFTHSMNIIEGVEPLWNELKKVDKYNLLILKGRSFNLCLNHEKAAKYFVEAFQYSNKDEKALYFKSLGLLWMKNFDASEKCANKVLELNSAHSGIYSILVHLWRVKGIDYIIDSNSDESLYSEDVSYQIAKIADIGGNFKKAELFFKNSHEKNNTHPDFLADYAIFKWSLLIRDPDYDYKLGTNQVSKKAIREIDNLLEKSFGKFPENDILLFEKRVGHIGHSTIIKSLLGDIEGCKEKINLGLRINPQDNYFLIKKAEILFLEENYRKSENIIKKMILEDSRAIPLFKTILLRENRELEIIEKSKELSKKYDNNAIISLKEMCIEGYMQSGNLDEAKKVLNSIENNESVLKYMNYRISIIKKENCHDYKEHIDKAYKLIEDSRLIDILNLARLLIDFEEFKRAIDIYEDYLNLKRYSLHINDLLYCYYRIGNLGKVIEICEFFREKDIYKKYLLNLEIDVYIKINDYDMAKKLINLFLDNFDECDDLKFQLANINLVLNNYGELNSYLNEEHDFTKISFQRAKSIYSLYKIREYPPSKILDILYKIRNSNFDNVKAHEFYIFQIISNNIDLDDDKPSKIDFETASLVKYNNDSPEWKLLTKDNKIDKFSEFDETDELIKIINHEIGDIIELEYNSKVKILDIVNKYYFAFRRSQQFLKGKKTESLHMMQLNEDINTQFDPIFEIVDQHSELVENLEQYYKKNKLPLFLFSKAVGRDIIETYFHLANTVGIKSSYNGKLLGTIINKKIVLDITSLLTIHILDIKDEVLKLGESIIVSFSTFFLLKEIYHNREMFVEKEVHLLGEKDGNRFITEGNYKNKINLIKDLINWVEHYCELVPVYELLNTNDDEKKVIEAVDESYVTDSILLGKAKNCVSCSDDSFVREISKTTFNVRNICTEDIINLCFENKIFDEIKKIELINKLFLGNFRTIELDLENVLNPIFKNHDLKVFFKLLIDVNWYNKKTLTKFFTNMVFELNNCENSLERNVLIELIVGTFYSYSINEHEALNFTNNLISRINRNYKKLNIKL